MPKIIHNLRERLIAQTQEILLESGYSGVTIRGVAQACGSATGTVYNYFSSKDELVASAILDDWILCREATRAELAACPSLRAGLSAVLNGLASFARRYRLAFEQSGLSPSAPSYLQPHNMLRDQIMEQLQVLEQRFPCNPSAMAEKVMAETLLAAVSHGWQEDELLPVLEKLMS